LIERTMALRNAMNFGVYILIARVTARFLPIDVQALFREGRATLVGA
jgi:hypothetical protein